MIVVPRLGVHFLRGGYYTEELEPLPAMHASAIRAMVTMLAVNGSWRTRSGIRILLMSLPLKPVHCTALLSNQSWIGVAMRGKFTSRSHLGKSARALPTGGSLEGRQTDKGRQ